MHAQMEYFDPSLAAEFTKPTNCAVHTVARSGLASHEQRSEV